MSYIGKEDNKLLPNCTHSTPSLRRYFSVTMEIFFGSYGDKFPYRRRFTPIPTAQILHKYPDLTLLRQNKNPY